MGYPQDEPFSETIEHAKAAMPDEDRPMSPIAEAQMMLSETLGSLNHAVSRLNRRLLPVASENLRKINDAATKTLTAAGPISRERRGTSPTLEMIEQQHALAQSILSNVNTLSENLEV